ncbi:MAG: hypothetical protein ACYDAJ_07535 [Nitrosotalea sp.]
MNKEKVSGRKNVLYSLNQNFIDKFSDVDIFNSVLDNAHKIISQFTKIVGKINPEEDSNLFIQKHAEIFVKSIHAIADLLDINNFYMLIIMNGNVTLRIESKLKTRQKSNYDVITKLIATTKTNQDFHENFMIQTMRSSSRNVEMFTSLWN